MLSRRSVLILGGLAGGGAMRGLDAFAADEPIKFQVPANATDSHQHVIDPARFPLSPKRSYTPPPAPLSDLNAMHATLGIKRVVLVQPSFYGLDNACLLDGLKQLGESGRGIVVVDDTTPEATLDEMHKLGVRGVRINQTGKGGTAAAFGQLIQDASKRVAPRGWHVQAFLPLNTIATVADAVATLPTPIVFDHFGGARPEDVEAPAFKALCDLVKSGKCYVKLSAPYHESKKPDYSDMTPLARALVEANPDRMLWGSDFPHTDSAMRPGQKATDNAPFYPADNRLLLNLLADWAPDAAVRQKILVDNPAGLFGFKG